MTQRIAGAIMLATLLAAAGVMLWWWQGRHESDSPAPHATTADVTPARAETAVDASAARAKVQGSSTPDAVAGFDTPLPDGTIGDTYAELARRANAGDGLAAMALARTLALCVDYSPDQRKRLEDGLVEFAARAQDAPVEGRGMSSDQFVDLALGVLDQREARCPGIEDLGLVDRAAERDRWFALGLELGHPAALVKEANDMLKTRYPRRSDIINHAEELRLLRPQAMAMLQRAAAQGEPLALLRTATAHRSGDLAARDPVAAYAYLLAYRAGSPAADVPAVMVDGIERVMVEGLTPEQIAAAEARAEQIRALCCGGG